MTLWTLLQVPIIAVNVPLRRSVHSLPPLPALPTRGAQRKGSPPCLSGGIAGGKWTGDPQQRALPGEM